MLFNRKLAGVYRPGGGANGSTCVRCSRVAKVKLQQPGLLARNIHAIIANGVTRQIRRTWLFIGWVCDRYPHRSGGEQRKCRRCIDRLDSVWFETHRGIHADRAR